MRKHGPTQWDHGMSWPCFLPGQHSRADPDDSVYMYIYYRWTSIDNVSRSDLPLLLICHMVEWAGKRCSPTPPHLLWQVGELVLRSEEQESNPCPSPAAAFGRVGSAPCLVNTVKPVGPDPGCVEELTLRTGVKTWELAPPVAHHCRG